MTRGRVAAYRLLAGALALAALVHAGALAPHLVAVTGQVAPASRLVLVAILVTVATAVGACVLALVLVARSWSRPEARSLALFLAFLSFVWGTVLRVLDVRTTGGALVVAFEPSGTGGFVGAALTFLATAAFLRFSALFPARLTGERIDAPRRPSVVRRLRALAVEPRPVWGTAVALALLLGAMSLGMRGLVAAGVVPPPGELRPSPLFFLVNAAFVGVSIVAPLVGTALGIWNLATGYRLAPPEARRRALWLVAGAAIAGWLLIAGVLLAIAAVALDVAGVQLSPPDWLVGPLGVVLWGSIVAAPAVLVVSVALAMFYAGAVDPGLVLRRSTVVGAVGLTGVLLFAGLEEALSSWVESALGLPGFVGSMAAGAIAAGVMLPLRKWVEKVAKRHLPGQEEAES